jgi:hypothetical protein
MEGDRKQEQGQGDSEDNERHQQHPKQRWLPIVDSHWLGRVLATAEAQLHDPPGFFFAAMPTECTPQKSASDKKLEAASVSKTRAQLAANTAASGAICQDGSMEAAKTAEEKSQIRPELGPSGGCGDHAEVDAQTGATRDTATNHLLSDKPEREDTSSEAPSQGLATSPKKKGRFDQKMPDGNTG